jgi:DNA-binding SARP family transcriptional activator/WD40 repeat protein
MEFRVLGTLEVLADGQPLSLGGPKQRAVLAMLLVAANHPVSTDQLVDGLWGDDPPRRAAATLQVYVSNLRKALEPGRAARTAPSMLLTQPPGYLLAVEPEHVDLFRFEELLGVARAKWADGCVPGAAVLFREALALWREAPLADLAREPFARFEVPRLEEARTGAIEDRVEADLALGRDVELLPELEALVARNPYRERLRGQLMLALYRAGRQADALAAYQAARRTLVDELGLEPGRELREIEAAILVQDPALAQAEPTPIDATAAELVLRAATGTDPDPEVVRAVVEEGRHSARRADEALCSAIDRERTRRVSARLAAAGSARADLVRARRVLADSVLDRRRRDPRRVPASRTGRMLCPYKGLLRFEPEDAAWYFGRERLVAELLAAVASSGCTGIVGASGSGKSSLARAGLLAALYDDALPGSASWPRVLVTPGADPMCELAHALAPACHAASPEHVRDRLLEEPESLASLAARAVNGADEGASLFVVVDQLEEVFTTCSDDARRERFLDVLVQGACDPDSPVRILTAIRADYYGRCAEHPAFAELLAQTNVLVGPMRPDELQRAIEEPAHAAGLALEDGLVDRIFEDVGTEPGSLPLLQTALLETWARRDGNLLTLDGYAASGGVRGAVAHLAEDVYGRMSSSEREIARDIFLRLAEPSSGSDDVRRRAQLEELVVDDDYGAVLATLVEQRLVVTGDAAAEVAHEALLREWPRLRGWLEEDREGRRLHHRLAASAAGWDAEGRDPAELYRGARLASALEWSNSHPREVNRRERDFLDTANIAHDAELRTARRTARRLRTLLAATAVLLVVAIAAGSLSLIQRSEARDRAQAAELAQLATQAATLPPEEFGRALLLGVEVRRLDPSNRAGGALAAALADVPAGLERVISVPGGMGSPDVSRDRRRIVTAGGDGKVRIVAASSGRVLRTLDSGSGGIGAATFSPDGHLVVVSPIVGSGGVRVFRVRGGKPAGTRLDVGPGFVIGLFVPNDSTQLVTASSTELIRWDLSDPEHPHRNSDPLRLPEHPTSQAVTILAVSPDGRTAATSAARVNDLGPEGSTDVWDLESGARLLGPLPGRPGTFTTDGTQLALRRAGQIAFVDARTGADRSTLPLGFNPDNGLEISDDGQRLAVSDETDGGIHVFDLATRQPIGPAFTSFGRNPYPMAFLANDRLLIGSLEDVKVWRYRGGAPRFARPLPGHTGGVSGHFTPDGNEIITTGDDHQMLRFRARDGRPLGRVTDQGVPEGLAVVGRSPDDSTVAVLEADGIVSLWDSRTGTRLSGLASGLAGDLIARWSPDGSALAITSADDQYLALWDVSHRRRPEELHRVRYAEPLGLLRFRGPTFSPDGRVVAVNDAPRVGWVTFVDVARGEVLRKQELGGQVGGPLVYSPDGEAIVTIRFVQQQSIVVLDAATGKIRAERPFTNSATGWAFVHGGRRVATQRVPSLSSELGPTKLELWDATTLEPFGKPVTIDGRAGNLGGANRDGSKLVLGTTRGSALLLDLDPRHWQAWACRIAGRNLTRAEWDQYLPGRDYHRTCAA